MPELAQHAIGGFLDAAIVEVDPVAAHVLDREPVAGFEVASRRARALAEERVVPIEALDQRGRDRVRGLGGRQLTRRQRGGRDSHCGTHPGARVGADTASSRDCLPAR